MKIEDITEGYVSEAPAGLGKRFVDFAKSKRPFDRDGRDQATGRRQVNATANQLWRYFQQQLGSSGKGITVDTITKFFTQPPYKVDPSVINQAFQAVGVQKPQSNDDGMAAAMKNIGKAAMPDNTTADFYGAESVQESAGTIDKSDAEKVFMYIVQNAPENFKSSDKGTIPKDVIDVVKSLKPAQKKALGQTLLGKQVNV